MSKMKALQPEMEKIKEHAGDDRMKMQQEVMALYKREKVNPAAGCLPILLQIPIFFSLYKVIFVTIELRHAPFFGWIRDLSAPDPTSILNLFGLLPWAAPGPGTILAIISIGVWPILLGISMWLQQKLNPTPTDKTQAMIFAWMPWIFMFMLGSFASGLVIYWVANNIITFAQQYTIMRSQGVEPNVLGNIFSALKRRGRRTDGVPARVSQLWRHPIKGHGVEAVAAVDARRRRHHALGPGLGDRPRGRPGRARRPRLGALRQLQPRRQVARADGDPRPGRRGAPAPSPSPTPAASRSPWTPTTPRTPRGCVAWVRPLADPDRAAPGLRGARRRPRHDRQRLPLGLDPEPRQPRAPSAERLGQPLAMERFRGNLWLDGPRALGGVRPRRPRDPHRRARALRVRERITRCKATTVNPATGRIDADTLGGLRAGWGHQDFGVYAEVDRRRPRRRSATR